MCKYGKTGEMLIALVLTVSMLLTLSACGSQDQNNGDAMKPSNDMSSAGSSAGNVEVVVEGCYFVKEIRAKDGEVATTAYPETDGKVYVDFVASIENQGDTEISADDVSGYVTYDDLRYDFQYCSESYTGVSVDDTEIPANDAGRIHLFAKLPADAEKETSLEAIVSIGGKEYKEKVKVADTADALTKKTELKAGDKESLLNGAVEFEVVNCVYSKYMTATDYANAEQYTVANKKIVDAVIKVTNNLPEGEITDIFGYVKIGDVVERANLKVETENNTELDYGGIAPGKTEYVHIYVALDENTSADDAILRFNFGGNCYYIKAK